MPKYSGNVAKQIEVLRYLTAVQDEDPDAIPSVTVASLAHHAGISREDVLTHVGANYFRNLPQATTLVGAGMVLVRFEPAYRSLVYRVTKRGMTAARASYK